MAQVAKAKATISQQRLAVAALEVGQTPVAEARVALARVMARRAALEILVATATPQTALAALAEAQMARLFGAFRMSPTTTQTTEPFKEERPNAIHYP